MTKQISRGELLAEYLGSMFLVMAAVASMLFFTYVLESTKYVALLANAITVAFVLCVLIEMFGPVSGAHFNPIVTLVMLLEKQVSAGKAALFVLVQTLGGITGTALTHLMFWDEIGSLFLVSETVRSYVYFGEVIGTFILVLAILMLIKTKSNYLPIMVGLLVGGQIMATSSTMVANPQVTIARILTGTISGIRPIDGLVFIVMQVVGGLLAYGVYRLVFAKHEYKS